MEANERKSRTWDEGGPALQEFQRVHHEMGGAIAVGGFELENDLAGWGIAQAFIAQGGARDAAIQTVEGLRLLGTTSSVATFA